MLSSKTLSIALATSAGLAVAAQAAVPGYSGFDIQASDRTGHRLNTGTIGSINASQTPVLGEDRQVAFRYTTSTGSAYYPTITDFLWYGQNAVGGVIAQTTSNFGLVSNSISDDGKLAFSFGFGSFTGPSFVGTRNRGVYVYNPSAPSLTTVASGASDYQSAFLSSGGNEVATRLTVAGVSTLREITLTPPSNFDYASQPTNYNFLSSGKYADGYWASATRLTSVAPIVLTRFDPSGVAQVVSGAYTNIGNTTFDINASGDVVFWGRTGTVDKLVLASGAGPTYTEIAVENSGLFGNFTGPNDSSRAPAISDSGLIAFRAPNSAGVNTIWVTDGVSILDLISVGDSVLLPDGVTTATILSFGTDLDINDAGDVSFIANYVGGGKGVYVATVPEPTALGLAAFAAVGLLRRRKA